MEGASPDGALLLGAILLLALSGVPGLFARKGGSGGERLAAILACAGSAARPRPGRPRSSSSARASGWSSRARSRAGRSSSPPTRSRRSFSFRSSSSRRSGPSTASATGRRPSTSATRASSRFFMGLLAASMAAVLVARSGVAFLVAWEVMALAAFFAATTEDRQPAVREAGVDLPRRDARRDALPLRDDGGAPGHDGLFLLGGVGRRPLGHRLGERRLPPRARRLRRQGGALPVPLLAPGRPRGSARATSRR